MRLLTSRSGVRASQGALHILSIEHIRVLRASMRCTFSRVNTFGPSARPLRDVPCVHGRPRFRTTMRVRTPTVRYKFCGVAGHAVHDGMRCLLAVSHSVSDLSPTCENVRRHSKSGVQTSQRRGCTSWRVNTCGFITRSSAAFHCVPRH